MRGAGTAPADGEAGLEPVTSLPGVGPAIAATLAKLGIERVQDLWFHLPLRHEDRTRLTPVSGLVAGTPALVEGTIQAVERGFRPRPQLRVVVADSTGALLVLRFLHFRGNQAARFAVGARVQAWGEPRPGLHGLEMVHPEYRIGPRADLLRETLTPVYPTTAGLGQQRITNLVERSLERLPPPSELELLPADACAELGLMPLHAALLAMHRPQPGGGMVATGDGRARQRLAFEELLAHHLALRGLRAQRRALAATPLKGDGRLATRLLQTLPFAPTAAQRRVVAEIAADLASATPMLRLVQGDVGSGKTLVAALAALAAIEAGVQVALIAPTELLAEQHLDTFRRWLEPLGIEPVWLAGKVQGRARSEALAAIAGGAPLVLGTHALMQQGVEFARLGLAIIDEQHRFGVHQRLELRDKGRDGNRVPHQLVMTATPIPRTLAMTAYADLDLSVIDELPPGRSPVRTVVMSTARREELIERLRTALGDGRQAYWVCTLIEESELLEAQAAEVAHAALEQALHGFRVGLVHGRMKPAEKQAAMQAFAAGDIQLLVATTVIEVGVDVPNASLMVIENAERLGLSQLHQLRGRVGRGSTASACVLLYQPPLSAHARERLAVMRDTTDGFRIAEKDLELRGPGEVLGTRQTGELALRIADLARDGGLLPSVQVLADRLLSEHPQAAGRLVRRWIGVAGRYAGA